MIPKENEYLYSWPLTDKDTVIEAGAYHGEFALEMVRRYGCSVVTFEPMERFYKLCKAAFADDPRITLFNAGLGNEFTIGNFSYHGSMSGQFNNDAEVESRRIYSIQPILEEYEGCALLALNCEGGEFPILEAIIEHGYLPKIKNILVQFHPVIERCEERYNAIQSKLKETHNCIYENGWIWQKWSLK